MTLHFDQWSLWDDEPDSSAHSRTLFALGNGHLGLRGCLEEDADVADQAFVNGFYETWPISYAEEPYGLAQTGQTIQPVPNPTRFTLRVNGESFDPHHAAIRDYSRTLDLRMGRLDRRLTWTTADGTEVRIESTRLVSLTHPGLAWMSYRVCPTSEADVEITHHLTLPGNPSPTDNDDPRCSTRLPGALHVVRTAVQEPIHGDLDADRTQHELARAVEAQEEVEARSAEHGSSVSRCQTANLTNFGKDSLVEVLVRAAHSGTGVACAVAHQVECETIVQTLVVEDGEGIRRRVTARLNAGVPMTLSALASYSTDGPLLDDEAAPLSDDALITVARTDLGDAPQPWSDLPTIQKQAMATWWDTADVEVDDSEQRTQSAIRWNLFQTFQATAATNGSGTPAKGVTGDGYDGHTFWDAEAMVLPTLAYTHPRLARTMLSYRYATLARARQRATELHHPGALFPWRTIDGREASAFFEAGTAQYHIDADIAYAVNRYVRATGDMDYLRAEGIDILVETARMWADSGFFDETGNFHIHGVTGPDEYSALVDDNTYTNVMAAANFDAATSWIGCLRDTEPQAWADICQRLALSDEEITVWSKASHAMTIVYDEGLGIHGQDAGFLAHKVWDFASTPPEMYPLLLHFHPLTIYRHQVLKQADLVLALMNRPDLFSPEEMLADFDYYDPLTTGDSTLSASPQAIMAARVGHLDLAESYFRTSLFIDLDDSHRNAKDGVHIANAASVWSTLVMGFAGFRDYDGFRLDPSLPPTWNRLSFRLILAGSLLHVAVTPHDTTLTLLSGAPIKLTVSGRDVLITEASATIARMAVNPADSGSK